ncbi:methylated-DNA--[protein]-cysteine S-methyltransferase [Brevibacterium oceani]|uniref:methylated-DNA--[protein]-cysteine S-methyltransferase n=2 Tax=Brevibacterium oceani TaxID=358099 RepID=UPI002811E13F|nr:methylated-DNA--[protein]-cysteine S-methyltransferase [Brevibacterium oceani]
MPTRPTEFAVPDMTARQHRTVIDSPLGPIMLTSDGTHLTGLYLEVSDAVLARVTTVFGAEPETNDDLTIFADTAAQLGEYFAGHRRGFDLPLAPQGTEFQRSVWQGLLEIPYGHTANYGELAEAVGRPTAARAVGAANGKNPISIIVPCHRVIGANGSLTGYAWGEDKKRRLLTLESHPK